MPITLEDLVALQNTPSRHAEGSFDVAVRHCDHRSAALFVFV